jgi:hypothetical protein
MDNINSVGDFIKSVFSTLVNKDDEIFKALFASDDESSPGTAEKIFSDLEETRNKWCNTPNVYEQEGEMLEKTLSFFSVLSRIYDENDEAIKKRNRLLYIRNGDTLWGDRWDIINLFKTYFETEFVYIINDTDDKENNLLIDGDFEEHIGWTLESCEYTHEARFSERFGLRFDNYGKCFQKVNVQLDSTYFLHFFQNGNLDVEIKDNNGRYWKPAAPHVDEFGSWVSNPYKIRITGIHGNWDPRNIYFLTDQSISNITVIFMGIDGEETHLDYVRLFRKEAYSTFTLIAIFSGRYTPDTMGLAPGTDDPIIERNYEGFNHFSGGKHDADHTNYNRLSFFETAALNSDENQHDAMNYDDKSFFESAAINDGVDPVLTEGKNDKKVFSTDNDLDPVMADGKEDPGEITAPPNDAYIGGTPLAPWNEDKPGITVDYSKMSYIEQAHLFGTEGTQQESIYTELLEIVRAGGIPSYIEILIRELDE